MNNIYIQLIIFCLILIQQTVKTKAFVPKHIIKKNMFWNKLRLKINSNLDGKIKYTTNLYHLHNNDLTNIYTIIGSKNDINCNYLIKRLGSINKKFVFIDKTLFEQNNMDQLILYFNNKQKINLENIEQPWLFYEYKYILNDEVFRHLLL